MAPFSSILRHAVASKQLAPPSAGAEGRVGPPRRGRIKSFSQKSGWGFIQLVEQTGETVETSKDVFFHRADVTRTGPVDLRPGIVVHCRVVSTGKGEKASDINIVETEEDERLSSGPTVCTNSVVGEPPSPATSTTDDDQPIPAADPPVAMEAPAPLNIPTSAYSLRGVGNRIFWACTLCGMKNCIPGRLRVMVVCASCHHAHAVQQWVCRCSQFNKRDSRQCTACDELYATSCQQLSVLLAEAAAPTTGEGAVPDVEALPRRGPQRRSRWSHTADGWMHSVIGPPGESTWCQDATAGPPEPVKYDSSIAAPMAQSLASCQERLRWARAWLWEGRPGPSTGQEATITKDWLYCFSEELCLPQFRLFRPVQGCLALVPNPCADVANAAVLQAYEATGVALALAYAWRMPLFPILPLWMARVLLGLPTSLEDLKEFDPALFQKVDLLMKHSNVDTLNVPYSEEVACYGASKTFTSPHGPRVTQMNKHLYGVWLKDVHLSAAIEVQLQHLQRGFLATLLNSQLHRGLTPDALTGVINGDGGFDSRRFCQSLKVCPTLHAQPVLENWAVHTLVGLPARRWYQLLRLVTGVSWLPQDSPEAAGRSFTLSHDPRLPPNSLPRVNRLLGQLVLPPYHSFELMRQTLFHALSAPPPAGTGFPLPNPAAALCASC